MVYLDYNASTPLDPRVRAVVVDVLEHCFGNPSSTHRSGRQAADVLDQARQQVADALSVPSSDVVFTSGASEASQIGIVGAVLGSPVERRDVVVGVTEHKAVLGAAEVAARLGGGSVRTVGVQRSGELQLDQLREVVDDRTALVAIMAANNETGVLAPMQEIHDLSQQAGALFFCDMTQAVGKSPTQTGSPRADLVVLSSHKLYGPKGAGALVARRDVRRSMDAFAAAGGQERGLRGGTQNTPAIAGFGAAAQLASKECDADATRLAALRGVLERSLCDRLERVSINAGAASRLPNTANVRFHGADADAVMASMPDIEVSSGSACQAAVSTPSHVLTSMGLTSTAADESLRFSLGRPTTDVEIAHVVEQVVAAVTRVRELTA